MRPMRSGPMYARLRTFLRIFRSDQSGQSLIIVAIAMTVIVGVAAFSIDVASWYQKHHQAQVVADSAALAAANCLANPNRAAGKLNGTTVVPTCTSSTDTADAQTVAVDYAAANNITITASQVCVNTTSSSETCPNGKTLSAGSVNVSATTSAPSFFAKLFGISSTTQTAGAQAEFTPGVTSTACTPVAQSSNQCYAIYTSNTTCGTNNGWVTGSTSEVINGVVHSQGSLNITNGSFTFNGPITYSSGNCTYTQAGNATMSSGGSYYTPTAGGNEPTAYWPMDYSAIFPACSTSGAYQCTGPNGTPSYCGNAAASYSFNYSATPTGIYCAYGNGTVSNPATWTGAITFSNGASWGSSGSPKSLTMIAGYVNATSSTLYLQPATNASGCQVYAVDSDSAAGGTGAAIEFGNGTYNFTGTMFAPNGTVNLNSTSATAAFLEAQNVDTVNLSFAGDGPITGGSSSSSSGGTDSLSQ